MMPNRLTAESEYTALAFGATVQSSFSALRMTCQGGPLSFHHFTMRLGATSWIFGKNYNAGFRQLHVNSYWAVGIAFPAPVWLLLIALLIAILFSFERRQTRRWLRRCRHAEHLCPTCSYDLRAHPPGSNCPECGTAVDPAHPK